MVCVGCCSNRWGTHCFFLNSYAYRYTDAGNEHPLEQVLGLSIVWMTMHVVAAVCGLHVITIVTHFVLYAALALMNHTNMDVSFQFLGFDYSVGAHEMHHRHPECNMAQYWMGLDKYVLGTYRSYTDGIKSGGGGGGIEKKKTAGSIREGETSSEKIDDGTRNHEQKID